MSLLLTLLEAPQVPLEAEQLSSAILAGKSTKDIELLTLHHGNKPHHVADFFAVKGSYDGTIHLEGDLARVKHIGAEMNSGTIHIHGDIGEHVGAAMTGGHIIVDGNAGDWVAPEMAGGLVEVKGNAGHMVGSAYRGSSIGMTGGTILVHGSARNETGHAMRNGLIAIGGNCGDFTGVNLNAGTIIVLGDLGIRAGAGMKRGTLVTCGDLQMLPTFRFACTYRPPFMKMYMHHLQNLGLEAADQYGTGLFDRWCGDEVELNKGEILVSSK